MDVIRSSGISFNVWEKTNADGKSSGIHDFTSLLGPDKKRELPSKMGKIFLIYAIITSEKPSEQMIANVFEKAQDWINLFLSLRDKSIGYKQANITPYTHAMTYHGPTFLASYKSVNIFTGQGVEKNNNVARTVGLRKSKKWNSVEDVLRMETR